MSQSLERERAQVRMDDGRRWRRRQEERWAEGGREVGGKEEGEQFKNR